MFSSSAVSRDERGKGVFRTFPRVTKSPRFAARLMREVRPLTSTTSTSSTTAPCLSRLGTISTSVIAGAKSVVKMATATCRCIGPPWDLFPRAQ